MDWQTPLWKMGISDEDFSQLKQDIRDLFEEGSNFKKKSNSKNIALYYAEWWRREYNGGVPGKEEIAASLDSAAINAIELFDLAKTGGEILGLRWIKRQNTLWFRTLLLQGGLPTFHIKNHSNQYTNFLLKVLEFHPRNVHEISINPQLYKLLPNSSRNDDIYECCLQIVDDIWNDNKNAFSIFDNKSELKEIGEKLKKQKAKIESEVKLRRNIQISIQWILEHDQEKVWNIIPRFNFPDELSSEEFALLTNSPVCKSEYFIFFNNEPICQLRRTYSGKYKTFWLKQKKQSANDSNDKIDICLKSRDGERFNLPAKGTEAPDLNFPCLLNEINSKEKIFCHGRNSKLEECIVIFSEEWIPQDKEVTFEIININGNSFKSSRFNNSLTLKNEAESLTFTTNSAAFEWQLIEDRPHWIIRSNLSVTRGMPKIFVYDYNGDLLKNCTINIRKHGETEWKKSCNTAPLGCIDYELIVGGISEYGSFYNIGDFNLGLSKQDTYSATIINNHSLFSISITEDEFLSVDINNEAATIEWVNHFKFPKEVQIKLSIPGQNKGLNLSIIPPFKGSKVIDSNLNILDKDYTIYIHNLLGYRIISTEDIIVRIFNGNRRDIYFERKISKGSLSLIEFQEEVHHLFRLQSTMNSENSVFFEFLNNEEIINSIEIKNHNLVYEFHSSEDSIAVKFENAPDSITLYAIQLDCSPSNIEPFVLERVQNSFILSDTVISKFIIFSVDSENNSSILPFFATTNTNLFNDQDRIQRYCDDLKDSGPDGNRWLQTIKYTTKAHYFKLPFIAFDHCRAVALSPELCARFFCMMVINAPDEFLEICKNFEQELGISFHWLSRERWKSAVEWATCLIKGDFKNAVDKLIMCGLHDFLCNGYQREEYNSLFEFIINGKSTALNDFLLKQEVQNMQCSIGEKINELPQGGPNINNKFWGILPVIDYNKKLWPVLLSPLAISISIASVAEESIFSENPHVRSNVQYIQWRFSRWYIRALLYCINRIIKHN